MPEFRPINLHNNPVVDTLKYIDIGIFGVLSKKAEALYYLYKEQTQFIDDIIASSNTFDLAFKVSDITKNEYSAEESKLIHGEKLKDFYEKAISINLEIAKFDPDYYNKVFEYIEKSKAAQIFFQLKDLNARNIAGIPDSLLLMEKIIKKNLAYVYTMIQKIKENNIIDSVKLRNYENKHFDLTMESDSLINLFETNYPQYKAIKYSLNYPTIKEIQNKLDVNSALVEYFTGDSVLYTVLISADTFLVFKMTTGDNFHKKIFDYVQSIKCFDINKFYSESSRLYELLVKPVYNFVINKNKLIIIPDEYLNNLPFETLITKRVKNKDFFFDLSLADFLIKKFNIVYNYSSFLWLNSKNPDLNRETGEGFLGMAPVFSEQNGYIKDNYDFPFDSLEKQICLRHITRAGKEFNVMPYTEIEVNSIIDLFDKANLPAKGYFIKDATEDAFKNNCEDYKYLHIATHGFVNEKFPGASGLAFSQIKQTDTIKNNQLFLNDGILFLNEIYNLEINSDLVVLSACETGVGKLVRGEGLMAISRGFVYSGVPNIVFSLWNISDKYTKDLMVEFYKDILMGKDYSTSIRNAKLKLINNEITSHPYYWSGFLLMGN